MTRVQAREIKFRSMWAELERAWSNAQWFPASYHQNHLRIMSRDVNAYLVKHGPYDVTFASGDTYSLGGKS